MIYEIKRKEIIKHVVHTPSTTTIAPGMFKLDLVPLPPRLLQNRDAHIDYLRHTQEHANTLQEIVEQAKAKQLLDRELDFTCKYATKIQELLVYVQDTCPNAITPSTKKVAVSPMNNVKKVSNCGSKPPGNKMNDKILQTPSRNKKNKVEAQPRKVNKMNHVVKPVCDVDVKHSLSNAISEILYATCNISMFDGVHDKCLLDLVIQIVLWYLDFECSKHMTENRSQLMNFVSKFLGIVRFGNDQITRIMGYGDYQLENVIISRVYYVEGLGHNLFSVGQFCDADLEVAFRKNTCFIRNLEGVDLLSGSRDTNLYTISLDDMLKSSSICLLSKASKTKSWLWHPDGYAYPVFVWLLERMGTPTLVCVWSCPNFSALAGRPFRGCDRLVPEPGCLPQCLLTQRFPPRQAYLDGTDTKSEPFEDPVETETHESPLTVAPPTSLPKSHPLWFPFFIGQRVWLCVFHLRCHLGLSASMAEVAAMFESAFRKRFRSSYESSPSLSPPDLPSQKRYRVEDDEDVEIEESLDSNSVSEDVKEEGPTAEDEDHVVGDEGLAAGDEGPSMGVGSHGLDDESHGLDDESRGLDDEGHSVESDGLGLGEEEKAVLGTPPLPEWSSGSLPISPSSSIVPSPISSPMIPLTVPSPVATPATAETEGFLTELGAQVEMQGGLIYDHVVRLEELSPALFERYDRDIGELFTRSGAVRDEIFSQRYRFKSLEHEQERVAVTFGAIWRPGENRELRLQLAEERRARLELAEIVDNVRRGQEPRGDI
ncbi:hypothetical protein Tco_1043674 [Tanacetum coccineum]|uniref:Retrovirus-related Pol polyprotein from transposon TNT 1-94-like beta-barrel domain-containing protein n=1 Tax=Tanacetum coccineum TaxID=301880 RepID=A0ABQ5GNQ2_9ASTR